MTEPDPQDMIDIVRALAPEAGSRDEEIWNEMAGPDATELEVLAKHNRTEAWVYGEMANDIEAGHVEPLENVDFRRLEEWRRDRARWYTELAARQAQRDADDDEKDGV